MNLCFCNGWWYCIVFSTRSFCLFYIWNGTVSSFTLGLFSWLTLPKERRELCEFVSWFLLAILWIVRVLFLGCFSRIFVFVHVYQRKTNGLLSTDENNHSVISHPCRLMMPTYYYLEGELLLGFSLHLVHHFQAI